MKKSKSQMPAVEIVQGKTVSTYEVLVSAIENLVHDARAGIKAAMNAIMLQTYWRTGEYIVEYEQNGADRAVYGDGLMRRLARDLETDGTGHLKPGLPRCHAGGHVG